MGTIVISLLWNMPPFILSLLLSGWTLPDWGLIDFILLGFAFSVCGLCMSALLEYFRCGCYFIGFYFGEAREREMLSVLCIVILRFVKSRLEYLWLLGLYLSCRYGSWEWLRETDSLEAFSSSWIVWYSSSSISGGDLGLKSCSVGKLGKLFPNG